MRQIFDCFTYYNEDKLLKLRFEILKDVVDWFVIAESTHTQTGQVKPLNFDINKFKEFSDKIIYIKVDDMPLHLNDAWANEKHQRNALARGLDKASDNDIVIISDLDENPNADAIKRYNPTRLYGTLVQRWYNYLLNNMLVKENTSCPKDWIRPKITTFGNLRHFFKTPENLRIYKKEKTIAGMIHYLRKKIGHQLIPNGGWHFSWIMTPEQMVEKISIHAHIEHNTDEIKQIDAIVDAIRNGRDILNKGDHFRLVPFDESFPPYLIEHLDEFEGLYLESLSPLDYSDEKPS